MADSIHVQSLRASLQVLRSHLASLDQHLKTVQEIITKKPPEVSDEQFISLMRTINGVKSLVPLVPIPPPAYRDAKALFGIICVIRVLGEQKLTEMEDMLTQLEHETPPSTDQPTPQALTISSVIPFLFERGRRIGFPSSVTFANIMGLVVSLASLVVGLVVFIAPSKPTIHPEYTSQLQALDKTKESIQALVGFIDEQKKQLQLSQSAVDALKNEESRIHPLVEADRKVIDAVFAVQEQRNQVAQSRERWVGFGLGVLASVVASSIISLIAGRLRAKRKT